MGNWQDAPAASIPGDEEPLLTNGQSEEPLLLRVKLAATLGLLPVDGVGKISSALPVFSTVIVRGLSALVAPTTVLANVRLGGSKKSSFNTRTFPSSVI
jgi:hypothetical protein